jgi:hypothetical protein
MHFLQQEYRLIPDQQVKVAEYRFYLLMGKALLLLLLAISLLMVYGLNQGCNFSLWWLFAFPAFLFIALLWKNFPAFCRCPDCKKKMVRQSKVGKVVRSRKLFDEIGPTRHYFVCDSCKLYMFLGESEAG